MKIELAAFWFSVVVLVVSGTIFLATPLSRHAPREPSPVMRGWTIAEKSWVIQRMKYHGIQGCIRDGKGYYFIRDGNRCRL
jgi:hypothetical protein